MASPGPAKTVASFYGKVIEVKYSVIQDLEPIFLKPFVITRSGYIYDIDVCRKLDSRNAALLSMPSTEKTKQKFINLHIEKNNNKKTPN